MELIADTGLKKIEKSIFKDWDNILTGNINADLIILGSSRGVVGYDPVILEDRLKLTSYNLSFDAGSYNLQYIKFRSYLENNKFPKVIVQNIDIPHFNSSTEIPSHYQFLPFLKRNGVREKLNLVDENFGKFHYIPILKYNNYKPLMIKGLLSFFGKNYSIFQTEKGFIPYNKKFKRDTYNLERLKLEGENIQNFTRYKEGLKFTKKILQEEIPLSTTVFLVWAPEYSERAHLSSYTKNLIIDELNSWILEMPNVYLIDLSEDKMSNNSIYFYDTFHFNKDGAEYFSNKISSEISQILDN